MRFLQRSRLENTCEFLFWTGLVYFIAILFIQGLLSFSWTRGEDTGFLYYMAWLMNKHGATPYVDFYDTSFPGTFFLYAWVTRIFGYSDTGFHLADICFLLLLMTMTFFLLKPLHVRVAAIAVVFFGLYYFSILNSMHLQRDYLAIIPVVGALLLAQRCTRYPAIRFFGVGFLFSISAFIKPHFFIGLPLVVVGAVWMHAPGRSIFRIRLWGQAILWVCIGILCCVMLYAAWLIAQGALFAFLEMATEYLPLYMHLDSGHQEVHWQGRQYYFLLSIVEAAKWSWVVGGIAAVAALGITRSGRSWGITLQRREAVLVGMLFSLSLLYLAYVFFGGKGWDYHWMPFAYFSLLCASLLWMPMPLNYPAWLRAGMTILLALAFLAYFFVRNLLVTPAYFSFRDLLVTPPELWQRFQNVSAEFGNFPYPNTLVADLVNYLEPRTEPGDLIEIRVTGTVGIIFSALLQLELRPVSQYPLQLMFYRYVDHPYIQRLRQKLLKQLEPPPRFILDDNQFSLLAKPDGSPGFPEYEVFLQEHYHLVYDNRDKVAIPYQFLLYERKEAGK